MNNEFIFDPTIELVNSISTTNNKVHIRIKQRNRKKFITTVEKLTDNLNLQSIAQKMAKTLGCNATVKNNDDNEKYIELFGDQRNAVKKILIDDYGVSDINIIVHGY